MRGIAVGSNDVRVVLPGCFTVDDDPRGSHL